MGYLNPISIPDELFSNILKEISETPLMGGDDRGDIKVTEEIKQGEGGRVWCNIVVTVDGEPSAQFLGTGKDGVRADFLREIFRFSSKAYFDMRAKSGNKLTLRDVGK